MFGVDARQEEDECVQLGGRGERPGHVPRLFLIDVDADTLPLAPDRDVNRDAALGVELRCVAVLAGPLVPSWRVVMPDDPPPGRGLTVSVKRFGDDCQGAALLRVVELGERDVERIGRNRTSARRSRRTRA